MTCCISATSFPRTPPITMRPSNRSWVTSPRNISRTRPLPSAWTRLWNASSFANMVCTATLPRPASRRMRERWMRLAHRTRPLFRLPARPSACSAPSGRNWTAFCLSRPLPAIFSSSSPIPVSPPNAAPVPNNRCLPRTPFSRPSCASTGRLPVGR